MGFAFSKANEPLEIGAPAPQIEVTTHEGKKLTLADVYSQGAVLIYFYPKADTPGCTKQACNLRDNFSELRTAGITVLGVSYDDVQTQAAFHEKYELPFTLIADGANDHALAKGFGVGGMMGGLTQAYKRQTFLVIDGKVAWRDLSATPRSQTEDVLQALKALEK